MPMPWVANFPTLNGFAKSVTSITAPQFAVGRR
jgi:hypothetical protein